MGWGSRTNPRSADGKSERTATERLFQDMAETFATRDDYEAYLDAAGCSNSERIYLEQFLPARLTQTQLIARPS